MNFIIHIYRHTDITYSFAGFGNYEIHSPTYFSMLNAQPLKGPRTHEQSCNVTHQIKRALI